MSDTVVSVESLGKKYRIRHQQQGQRYVALRDVLVDKTRGVFQKLKCGKLKTRNQNSNPNSICSFNSPLSAFPPSAEDFWALRDVSFEIRRGEAVGIIGRNGAGKSTLLKILSQITEPTSGRVRIKGRVASLLEVGTGFHPELTGRENIYLNGAILGMARAEIRRKFEEIVAFAEVEKFLDTPVKHFSSGMYVRLAFAVAAHLEPEILVVDEVLAVGDAAFQKKCLGKMDEVAKGGRTVLFVSHNMQTIVDLCSSVLMFAKGSVVERGEPRHVVSNYLRQLSDSPTGSISEAARVDHVGDRLRFSKLSVLNSAGNLTTAIHFGEDFTLELVVVVTEILRGVRLGVGLATTTGQWIGRVHFPKYSEAPVDLQPGQYILRATLKNICRPGTYIVGVGAHQALGHQTLDYLPTASRVNILEAAVDGEQCTPYDGGLVVFQAVWEFGQVPCDYRARN